MPVSMMELRDFGQCRTILGGQAADTVFCGEPTEGTKPYCAGCCRLYYVTVPVLARRRKQKADAQVYDQAFA